MRKILFTILLIFSLSGLARCDEAPYTDFDAAAAAASQDINDHHFAAAREKAQRALRLSKTLQQKAEALRAIGVTYEREGDHKKARAQWQQVLAMTGDAELAPTQAGTRFLIAFSYLREGDYPTARTKLRQVQKSDDADAKAKAIIGYYIGQSYFFEKNYAKAHETLELLLLNENLSPTLTAMTRLEIAQVYITEGNPEAARKILSVAQGEAQSQPSAVSRAFQDMATLQIAETYIREEKFEQARSELRKLIEAEIDSNLPDNQQRIARTLAQRAQLESADSYLAEKNYTRATEEYQKLLKAKQLLAPFQEKAEKQLQLIREIMGKN